MEKISVIIPTYNRASTLVRAIKSALAQTYPVHEVLVCDDGSDDDSRQIVTSLKEEKVKWVECGRNGRPSVPRNTGIKKSTGEWIAFLDSDDEWLPHKIEKQMKVLAASALPVCSTNASRVIAGKDLGPYLGYVKKTITFSDLLPTNHVICSSVLVNKELLKEVSFFPEGPEYKAIEDYALWLRVALKTDFVYLKEPLLNYNDEPASSVRANYTNVWELRKVIFTGFMDWMKEEGIEPEALQRKRLSDVMEEIYSEGKLSLWQRIKQKLR
jgi:teichuronic acid biosynthesis glycosyltransferase TuaG